MAKVTLGGITFAKLEDAKKFLREKMEAYEIDARIPDPDVSLWFEVLQKNEWFDEYVTHGIQYFAVGGYSFHRRGRSQRLFASV